MGTPLRAPHSGDRPSTWNLNIELDPSFREVVDLSKPLLGLPVVRNGEAVVQFNSLSTIVMGVFTQIANPKTNRRGSFIESKLNLSQTTVTRKEKIPLGEKADLKVVVALMATNRVSGERPWGVHAIVEMLSGDILAALGNQSTELTLKLGFNAHVIEPGAPTKYCHGLFADLHNPADESRPPQHFRASLSRIQRGSTPQSRWLDRQIVYYPPQTPLQKVAAVLGQRQAHSPYNARQKGNAQKGGIEQPADLPLPNVELNYGLSDDEVTGGLAAAAAYVPPYTPDTPEPSAAFDPTKPFDEGAFVEAVLGSLLGVPTADGDPSLSRGWGELDDVLFGLPPF